VEISILAAHNLPRRRKRDDSSVPRLIRHLLKRQPALGFSLCCARALSLVCVPSLALIDMMAYFVLSLRE